MAEVERKSSNEQQKRQDQERIENYPSCVGANAEHPNYRNASERELTNNVAQFGTEFGITVSDVFKRHERSFGPVLPVALRALGPLFAAFELDAWIVSRFLIVPRDSL